MRQFLISVAAIVTLSLGLSAQTFQLLDHPDGQLFNQGPYGLRLDFAGNPGTFSVSTLDDTFVTLTVSDTQAIISGTVRANFGNNDLFNLSYTLTDLTLQGGGAFNAGSGTGYIEAQDDTSTVFNGSNTFNFVGTGGNSVGDFLFDSFRLPQPGDVGVFRGWVQGDADSIAAGFPTRSANTQDFLVQVAAIPEPATWLMMIIGFAAVGLVSCRRRQIEMMA